MSNNLDTIISELSTQKQIILNKTNVSEAISTDYWIPYTSTLVLLNGVLSALNDISGRITTLEEQMANRMLCKKYDTE